MKATIWTNASGTTGTIDESTSVKQYYQGATFRPTAVLENKLKEYGDTNLYILIGDGKYVEGTDSSVVLQDQKKRPE